MENQNNPIPQANEPATKLPQYAEVGGQNAAPAPQPQPAPAPQPQAPQYVQPQPQPQAPQAPRAPQYPQQPRYAQPQYAQPQYAPKKANVNGIVGFIMSLFGLVFCWLPFVGEVYLFLPYACLIMTLISLIGLILSSVGLKRRPKGLAIAGLVIGIIAFIINIACTIGAFVAVSELHSFSRW